MALEANARNLVKDFFEALKIEAENLVFKVFPQRIYHLNDLLIKPEFRITSYGPEFISEVPTMVKTDGNVNNGEKILNNDQNLKNENSKPVLMASNKKLSEFIEIVKPHIKQLIEDINALKLWISILIPKNNYDNFGDQVQEQALTNLYDIEGAVHSNYLLFVNYYEQRAKLVKKVLQNPTIEDYQKSLKEHDEYYKIAFCQVMQEIRDYYINMIDFITKNMEKTK